MNLRPRAKTIVATALTGVLLFGGTAASLPALAAHRAAAPARLSLIHAGYLTVGSDATYPPMESLNPHTGQIVGADIDLAGALAREMGLKGTYIVNNSFNTIIPALQRHKFDVIMSSMNDTPDRAKKIAFVDYMRASEAILVKTSSSIHANNYDQMCGLTVAVQSGTTELDGMNAANKHCAKKISIKQFTADTDAYQAFRSGHADAYTGDLPVVALYVKNGHGALRMAGKAFGAGEDYGIGMLKNAHSLKSALQKALAKLLRTGEYSKILNKWGVGGASI